MQSFSQFYLTEALLEEGTSSRDPIEQIEHLEDQFITSGHIGIAHAADVLDDLDKLLSGKGATGVHRVEVDGGKPVVFGQHPENNKFFVTDHSGQLTSKRPRLAYSPEDIKLHWADEKDKQGYLTQALKHLPKIMPDTGGVFDGSILYDEKGRQSKNGRSSFKLGDIDHSISDLTATGAKTARSKMGIAVHTKYQGRLTMRSSKPDHNVKPEMFKLAPEVHVVNDVLGPGQGNYDADAQKAFKAAMASAAKAYEAIPDDQMVRMGAHRKLMQAYMATMVEDDMFPSLDGYVKWLTGRNGWKSYVPGAKAELMGDLEEFAQDFERTFEVLACLQQAKQILLQAMGNPTEYDRKVGRKPAGRMSVLSAVNGKRSRLGDRKLPEEPKPKKTTKKAAPKKKPVKEEVLLEQWWERPLSEGGFNPREPRDWHGRWTAGVHLTWPDVGWKPSTVPHSEPVTTEIDMPELRHELDMTNEDMDCRSEVLHHAMREPSESLSWYGDRGTHGFKTDHDFVSVTCTGDEAHTLAKFEDGENLTEHHNHPWDQSLSRGDLGIAGWFHCKRMFAHTPDGSVYSVSHTPEYDQYLRNSHNYAFLHEALDLSSDYVRTVVREKTFASLPSLGGDGDVDHYEKIAHRLLQKQRDDAYTWRITDHLICLFLSDAGIFDYKYHLNPHTQAFYGPFIAEIVDTSDWRRATNLMANMMHKKAFEKMTEASDEGARQYVMLEEPPLFAPEQMLLDYYDRLIKIRDAGDETMGEPIANRLARVSKEMTDRGIHHPIKEGRKLRDIIVERNFNPNEPREPKGSDIGGRWTALAATIKVPWNPTDEEAEWLRISPRKLMVQTDKGTKYRDLKITVAEMKEKAPEHYHKAIGFIRKYLGVKGTPVAEGTDDEVCEKYINFMANNLDKMYEAAPDKYKKHNRYWYVGANVRARETAAKTKLPLQTVAAVMSAFSAQMEWFKNIAVTERLIRVYQKHQKTPLTWNDTMTEKAKNILAREDEENAKRARRRAKKAKGVAEVGKKKYLNVKKSMHLAISAMVSNPKEPDPEKWIYDRNLNDMPTERTRGLWMQIYSLAHDDPHYMTYSPEGEPTGLAINDSDKQLTDISWPPVAATGTAVKLLDHPGDMKVISETLSPGANKQRCFYNNIVAPLSLSGDMTADSHMVEAAHFRPLASNSKEVAHVQGSSHGLQHHADYLGSQAGYTGTYAFIHTAGQQMAKKRKLLPCEYEAVVWQRVKDMFPFKMVRTVGYAKSMEFTNSINDLWAEYEKNPDKAGKTTKLNALRKRVNEICDQWIDEYAKKRQLPGPDRHTKKLRTASHPRKLHRPELDGEPAAPG